MTELNELAEQMVDRARAASREGELIALALCERDELDQIFCRHRGMQQLGLHWTTVHYKGTAPAISDLIGGHVQFSIDQISSSLSLIRDGRVRALAVSSAKRLA